MDIRRTVRMLALALTGLGASAAHAAADGSQLALPPGATVAIVVFEDLQCPDCARAHPGLVAASEASKVPLVIHDFPITRHVWALPAAVLARYFTSQSPALGVEFRSFIFENQKDVTPDNLRQFGERFAQQHELQLPPGHRSRRQAGSAGPGRLRPRQAHSPRIRAADVRARAWPRRLELRRGNGSSRDRRRGCPHAQGSLALARVRS